MLCWEKYRRNRLQRCLYLWRMLSHTEENYLKALFHLTFEREGRDDAGTNELAAALHVKPATVNDMLKRLKEKNLADYERYGKISLTDAGRAQAVEVVRKHRLWETFLFEKLGFSWDEVHEVAEQLEHIQSAKLIEKLDEFLEFPQLDPHGDVIPDAAGTWERPERKMLSEVAVGKTCKLVAVRDSDPNFLKYVDQKGLYLGAKLKVVSRMDFDGSLELEVNQTVITVSEKFAEHLFVL